LFDTFKRGARIQKTDSEEDGIMNKSWQTKRLAALCEVFADGARHPHVLTS
jgi:hypothetical protein